MVRRGFWFTAGAAAGVYGMVRARRIAEAFTVDGLRDRARAAGVGARMFRAEFQHGRVEAETEIRERIHVAAAGQRELASGPGAEVHAPPTRTASTPTEKDED